MNDPLMAAKDMAVFIGNLSRLRRLRLQPGDDIGLMAVRHESDILAVGLFGNP